MATKKSAGAKKVTKPATKPAAKKKAASRPAGYVGSGQFQIDLEALFGKLKKRAKPEKREGWLDEQLGRLPPKIAAEVNALFTLYSTHAVPQLCGLRASGYCSVPAQYDLDEEGVRDRGWFDDDDDIDFVMNALEIYNDQGSPFVLVAKAGVCLFYEDPHGYCVIADDVESFLRALVSIEGAARGKVPADEARRVLEANIGKAGRDDDEMFFGRTLAKAKAGPKAAGRRAARA